MENIWITAKGESINVSSMSNMHIKTVVDFFNIGIIPKNYLGGKEKWLEIFDEEIRNRRKSVINKQ